MLSIATLAYQGRLAAEMQTTGTLEERRTHLFAAYADAMFKRWGKATPYSPQQTVQWLVWLAAAMARQNQSVFYLEWLQPNWLPGRIPQWIVTRETKFLIRLIGVPVLGLFGWVVSGVAFGLACGLTWLNITLTDFMLTDVTEDSGAIQPAETLT